MGHKKKIGRVGSIFEPLHDFLNAANKSPNLEKELELARRIGKKSAPQFLLMSAQAIADVAIRHAYQIGETSTHLLAEAYQLAKCVNDRDFTKETQIKCGIFLADLLILPKLLSSEWPGQDELSRRQAELTDLAKKSTSHKPRTSEDQARLTGDLSELSVHLLLGRYGSDPNHPLVATNSTLSQDRSNGSSRGTWTSSRYDISVFANKDAPSDETYQLQVKNKQRDDDNGRYNLGISLICIDRLTTRFDGNTSVLSPGKIINEFLNRNPHNDRKIELRTDALLDMIDPLVDLANPAV